MECHSKVVLFWQITRKTCFGWNAHGAHSFEINSDVTDASCEHTSGARASYSKKGNEILKNTFRCYILWSNSNKGLSLDQRFLTFFISFTLLQNQKIYFTPNNVYCVKAWLFWKGPGQVLLESYCKCTFRNIIFMLTGTSFRVMLVRNLLVWDETLINFSSKQAWVLLRCGSLKVVEILNTFHSFVSFEPAYHWIKGQTVWKKDTAMYKCFFYWKMTNNLNHSVTQWDFVHVFYAQYLRFWEQWLKIKLSCHPWESIEIYFCIAVTIEESPALHRKVFWKGIGTSTASFNSVGNSSPNPHQNLEQS